MSTHAANWAAYGRQLVQEGEHALAIFALERAMQLGEDTPALWTSLGVARGRSNQLEGAIQCFQQAVVRDAKAIDAWCMMGELAVDIRQYELALEAFKKCYELDPEGAHPHGARAKALVRKTYKDLAAQQAK